MDDKDIAHINLRKHPVNRKFIIVLAQGTGYIVFVVARLVLFSHDRDVMVCAVHRRAHQVDCTRVHTDILFVGVFLMDCRCHKAAIRRQHETSHLCIKRYIAHASRNQNFLINLADALADCKDIVRLLIRAVRNANATRQVDKFNICASLFFQLDRHLKQYLRKHRIILICNRIACKEGMDTEMFRTFCFQHLECLK